MTLLHDGFRRQQQQQQQDDTHELGYTQYSYYLLLKNYQISSFKFFFFF